MVIDLVGVWVFMSLVCFCLIYFFFCDLKFIVFWVWIKVVMIVGLIFIFVKLYLVLLDIV